MKKWNAHTVIIEATRRCNMTCEHCLRGEAQNLDMSKMYIDALMCQMGYISEITFTGGEPSLVPEVLEQVLFSAKYYNVDVGSFYLVTNGKRITEEFAIACLKWYAYCEDNECTGVELSQDDFHDADRFLKYDLLKGLSFFSERAHTEYDHARMLAHRQAVRDLFDIPWTAITPRMQRLIYAINAIVQPENMIAAGVFCGNTFISNAGAAVGPGACYTAKQLIGVEIRPEEAERAERNVR